MEAETMSDTREHLVTAEADDFNDSGRAVKLAEIVACAISASDVERVIVDCKACFLFDVHAIEAFFGFLVKNGTAWMEQTGLAFANVATSTMRGALVHAAQVKSMIAETSPRSGEEGTRDR